MMSAMSSWFVVAFAVVAIAAAAVVQSMRMPQLGRLPSNNNSNNAGRGGMNWSKPNTNTNNRNNNNMGFNNNNNNNNRGILGGGVGGRNAQPMRRQQSPQQFQQPMQQQPQRGPMNGRLPQPPMQQQQYQQRPQQQSMATSMGPSASMAPRLPGTSPQQQQRSQMSSLQRNNNVPQTYNQVQRQQSYNQWQNGRSGGGGNNLQDILGGSSTQLGIAQGDVLQKIRDIIESEGYPLEDPQFDTMVKQAFPGAISNRELETRVVSVLNDRGFTAENTLLATSLCCDELARVLEDDFVRVYGNNFNLGGLAGFPFAGNTGFGAMAGHIPDNGNCLIIHGPHVGITQDGLVGKVEREGIALVDKCCGSAIAASGYLEGITNGGAQISTKIQSFSDFQQGAVQELILPHGRRLMEAPNRMIELPYALYESQDLLMRDIIETGSSSLKRATAVLGGIQINTSPFTLDYFHPLRFDLIDSTGQVVQDMLPYIADGSGGAYNRIAFAPDGFQGL